MPLGQERIAYDQRGWVPQVQQARLRRGRRVASSQVGGVISRDNIAEL
jgi:hypothetical protein